MPKENPVTELGMSTNTSKFRSLRLGICNSNTLKNVYGIGDEGEMMRFMIGAFITILGIIYLYFSNGQDVAKDHLFNLFVPLGIWISIGVIYFLFSYIWAVPRKMWEEQNKLNRKYGAELYMRKAFEEFYKFLTININSGRSLLEEISPETLNESKVKYADWAAKITTKIEGMNIDHTWLDRFKNNNENDPMHLLTTYSEGLTFGAQKSEDRILREDLRRSILNLDRMRGEIRSKILDTYSSAGVFGTKLD